MVYLSQESKSEIAFQIEVDYDEISSQTEAIEKMMKEFSKSEICTRYQTTRSNAVFQVEFMSRNIAEKKFNQLVKIFNP